jgi:hypothetical protein
MLIYDSEIIVSEELNRKNALLRKLNLSRGIEASSSWTIGSNNYGAR